MTENIINLEDRIESIRNQEGSNKVKKLCLDLANDYEGFKSIIVIAESKGGQICCSWINISTSQKIFDLVSYFFERFREMVNKANTKQRCKKCNQLLKYAAPFVLSGSWQCISTKCNK